MMIHVEDSCFIQMTEILHYEWLYVNLNVTINPNLRKQMTTGVAQLNNERKYLSFFNKLAQIYTS